MHSSHCASCIAILYALRVQLQLPAVELRVLAVLCMVVGSLILVLQSIVWDGSGHRLLQLLVPVACGVTKALQ